MQVPSSSQWFCSKLLETWAETNHMFTSSKVLDAQKVVKGKIILNAPGTLLSKQHCKIHFYVQRPSPRMISISCMSAFFSGFDMKPRWLLNFGRVGKLIAWSITGSELVYFLPQLYISSASKVTYGRVRIQTL